MIGIRWPTLCGRFFIFSFIYENYCTLIRILLYWVNFENKSALVQLKALSRLGDKPLPEPMIKINWHILMSQFLIELNPRMHYPWRWAMHDISISSTTVELCASIYHYGQLPILKAHSVWCPAFDNRFLISSISMVQVVQNCSISIAKTLSHRYANQPCIEPSIWCSNWIAK